MRQTDDIAQAIKAALISPNVADDNLEPANVVDVLHQLAEAVRFGAMHLGSGNTSSIGGMGAVDAHGLRVLRAGELIAEALREVAAAIRARP